MSPEMQRTGKQETGKDQTVYASSSRERDSESEDEEERARGSDVLHYWARS